MTYEKEGQLVNEAEQFLYLEEIYLCYPNRFELYRSKHYTSKVPIDKKNSRIYSESHGCYVQRYWKLETAPKQYLISKEFKPKL